MTSSTTDGVPTYSENIAAITSSQLLSLVRYVCVTPCDLCVTPRDLYVLITVNYCVCAVVEISVFCTVFDYLLFYDLPDNNFFMASVD